MREEKKKKTNQTKTPKPKPKYPQNTTTILDDLSEWPGRFPAFRRKNCF